VNDIVSRWSVSRPHSSKLALKIYLCGTSIIFVLNNDLKKLKLTDLRKKPIHIMVKAIVRTLVPSTGKLFSSIEDNTSRQKL
jgi:hypothetical protein